MNVRIEVVHASFPYTGNALIVRAETSDPGLQDVVVDILTATERAVNAAHRTAAPERGNRADPRSDATETEPVPRLTRDRLL